MAEATITITRQKYFDLCMAEEKLQMLEGAGVDNWDGCNEAFWPDFEGEDLDQVEARLRKEIFN